MSDLRYRGDESVPGGGSSGGGESDPLRAVSSFVKSIDAFPKYAEEARARGAGGGLPLSVTAIVVMAILALSETVRYLAPPVVETVGVDSQDPAPLHITIDITVHGSRCEFVELHSVDQAERMEHDFGRYVARYAIRDSDGTVLNPEAGNGREEFPGSPFVPYCGSCSGHGTVSVWRMLGTQCCNTCQEITQRNPSAAAGSMQCQREQIRRDPSVPQSCRVKGSFKVPKLSGNFHIGAPNTTHSIRFAGFGDDPTGSGSGALSDHSEHVPEQHTGVFRYHLKVVPHVDASRPHAHLFKYATNVLRDVRPRTANMGGMFVGRKSTIFFVYDFSPYAVQTSYASRSFFHYLTELCAVVGGVYAIAKLIDMLTFSVAGSKGQGMI